MSKVKYFIFKSGTPGLTYGQTIILPVDNIGYFSYGEKSLSIAVKNTEESLFVMLDENHIKVGVENIVLKLLSLLSMEFQKDDMEDDRSDQLDLDMVIDSILLDMDSDDGLIVDESFKEVTNG